MNILNYVGAIGAVITSIAYMVIIIVLVLGIEQRMESDKMLVVSIIGAVAGIAITFMLRGQGVQLASNEEESKKIMNEYNKLINKTKNDKKLHTINFHLIISFITDLFTKTITIAITTYYIIDIFQQGNGDFGLIGLAIANLMMFICFGLIALSKTYNYYLNNHLSVIKERIERMKNNADLQKREVFEFTTTSGQEQERYIDA